MHLNKRLFKKICVTILNIVYIKRQKSFLFIAIPQDLFSLWILIVNFFLKIILYLNLFISLFILHNLIS